MKFAIAKSSPGHWKIAKVRIVAPVSSPLFKRRTDLLGFFHITTVRIVALVSSPLFKRRTDLLGFCFFVDTLGQRCQCRQASEFMNKL